MKGLWLNEVFLRTLGAHYTQVSGACKVNAFGDPKTIYPIGAVGLCAASVRKWHYIFMILANTMTG